MDQLAKRLRQTVLLKSLDEGSFQIVMDSIQELRFEMGNVVIKEGDYGDCMYIVERGTLKCTKVLKGNTKPTFLKEYEPGESFGELSLLYNTPRAATITAKTECILFHLDRETFNHIVKDSAIIKREKFEAFLKNVKLLERMQDYERSKLADALQEELFLSGEYVIKEGE